MGFDRPAEVDPVMVYPVMFSDEREPTPGVRVEFTGRVLEGTVGPTRV